MKIKDLYDLFKEQDEGDVKKLFYDNIVISNLPSDQMIVLIRNVRESCMVDIDGMSVMDNTLSEVAMKVAFVSASTDLEFNPGNDDTNNNESDGTNSYDMIVEMGLCEYIAERAPGLSKRFATLCKTEETNYINRMSVSSIVNKYISQIASSASAMLDALTKAIENFDPSNIESMKELLTHMNDNVQEVSKIINMPNNED